MGDDLSMMGNFKGVMLCNRPAQIPGSLQTVVGPTSSNGPSRPAFVSSVVPDSQLGLPPVRHARVAPRRDPAKNKADDVTWRHKKWLGEFQERRQAISQSLEERVQEQQERAKRFAEKSQAMRDAIRGIKASSGDRSEKASAIEAALQGSQRPKYVPTEYVDVSQQYPSGAPQPKQAREEVWEEPVQQQQQAQPQAAQPNTQRTTSKKPSKQQQHKPGWARTEAEDEDFLDAEADSLLDFAAGLDYQKYIDDLEVREAIKFVQDRVKGLEESKQSAEAEEEERQRLIQAGELEEVYVVDEAAGVDEDGQPKLKKIVRRVKRQQKQPIQILENENWNASSNVTQDDGAQSERAAQDALTKTVLESNRGMRNIHSSASVRAMMEKEGKTTGGAAGGVVPGTSATTLRRSQLSSVGEERAPVISTIYEKDGPTQKGPNPSNLPFLYRHPGI